MGWKICRPNTRIKSFGLTEHLIINFRIMLKLEIDKGTPLNILCLGAHSDDIEIGCGGTLLYLQKKYRINHVKWIVFSRTELRAAEAMESANIFLENVESKSIEIKSFKDSYFPSQLAEIKDSFNKINPEIPFDMVFTHYRKDRHQDHRIISDLTWNTFRNQIILEYEIPKFDGDLGHPNFFVPLDQSIVEQKNEIILNSFVSQSSKHWFDSETFKLLLRLRGMESVCKYAEAFYVRKIVF